MVTAQLADGRPVLRRADARRDRRPRRALARARAGRRPRRAADARRRSSSRRRPAAAPAERQPAPRAPSARSGRRPRSSASPALKFLHPRQRVELAPQRRRAPRRQRRASGSSSARRRAQRRAASRASARARSRAPSPCETAIPAGRREPRCRRARSSRCAAHDPEPADPARRRRLRRAVVDHDRQVARDLRRSAFSIVPLVLLARAQAARPLPEPLRPEPRRPVRRCCSRSPTSSSCSRKEQLPPAHRRSAGCSRSRRRSRSSPRSPRSRSSRSATSSTSSARRSASTGSTSRSACSTSSPSARSPSTALMLGGWSSGSKYSLPRRDALRRAADLLRGLAWAWRCVGVIMTARLAVARPTSSRPRQGIWYIVPQFVGFLIFMVAGFAETNRAAVRPPEADAELVGGYKTEYGGDALRLLLLRRVHEHARRLRRSPRRCSSAAGCGPGPAGWLDPFSCWPRCCVFVFFFIWVRATLPRLRYDQLMSFGWKVLLPLATLNVLVTAIVVVAWTDVSDDALESRSRRRRGRSAGPSRAAPAAPTAPSARRCAG